ncbi:hypothetical protein C5167_019732 [Papaver somniferum]|uniref:Neprosin PEP catalytic domain-containing protein n=1 Tax=Papaver somniferum TaxID=3469 RepID=A0A4Y7IR05_PAPSO|nr:uncharacterized protein LOC113353964 [Papaver somniferum]RZC51314.1 hypothetical protein C5167_019732 [Papaver somniferum]
MAKLIDITRSLVLTILVFGILIHELVQGRKISDTTNKAVIKTIKGDNDEIIDCYNIFKQPAFDNELLVNQTIQMRPGSFPEGMQSNLEKFKPAHSWHKYGTCPEGSVPIRRFGKIYHPKRTLAPNQSQQSNDANSNNEYAVIRLADDNFQGVQAVINVWKPVTEPGEISASQIMIASSDYKEVIVAGWQVNKVLNGDDEPRFFLYWTVDGFQSTGCYNNLCPGFVQTSTAVTLGSSINPISVFNGAQYDTTFLVFREQSTGNWWVLVQGVEVGYWPASLFKELSEKATRIELGGQILNTRANGVHTSTQMGSGHLASEGGSGVSSYFYRVQIVDASNKMQEPQHGTWYQTNPNCYDVKIDERGGNGFSFHFGGPGLSAICQ